MKKNHGEIEAKNALEKALVVMRNHATKFVIPVKTSTNVLGKKWTIGQAKDNVHYEIKNNPAYLKFIIEEEGYQGKSIDDLKSSLQYRESDCQKLLE